MFLLMLTIKRLFYFYAVISIGSLLSMSFNTFASEKEILTKEALIGQVEYLYTTDTEALNYQEVVQLSKHIILQREQYPNEILAKTYLLLANVASNQGELATALQFIQDGLTITSQHHNTQLRLQLKLASILTEQKHYLELLSTSQKTIDMAQDKKNINYLLLALGYKSIALASQNQAKNALSHLQQIETIIKQNPSFSDHITLLAIIANTYYQLGIYQTALTIQLRILTLRFNLNKLTNIDQTYYQLANTYYQLELFDDAYNAYWEAKIYANKKNSPVYIAYAKQGLARTLSQQKQLAKAKIETIAAKNEFYQHNLMRPYLETIISLIQLHYLTEQTDKAASLLLEAEKLSKNIELKDEYIILYQLLANTYQQKNDLSKAYSWQTKYLNAVLKSHNDIASRYNKLSEYDISVGNIVDTSINAQPHSVTMKLAEKSELASVFSKKYQQQKVVIFILLAFILLLLSFIVLLWLKQHTTTLKNTYEALEQSNNIVTNPMQIKQLYQKSFDMARKYNYPLTLGYISISNWQELTFQFNKKVVGEVTQEIADVIGEHLQDFENAGVINNGEYLLLFPHQHKNEVTQKVEKLVSALKLRFFANLGSFSVNITYSIKSPNYQDIDPYVFLSQLSGSIKTS